MTAVAAFFMTRPTLQRNDSGKVSPGQGSMLAQPTRHSLRASRPQSRTYSDGPPAAGGHLRTLAQARLASLTALGARRHSC